MKKVILVALFSVFLGGILGNNPYAFSVWALNDSNNTSSNSTANSQNATGNMLTAPTGNNSTISNPAQPSGNSTFPTNATSVDSTLSVITLNPTIVNPGSQVQLAVKVSGTSDHSNPTGTVSWSDGSAGGKFNPISCTLSSGVCSVSYVPPSSFDGTITITGSYGGDSTHYGSSSRSALKVNVIHNVTTTISSSTTTVYQGSQVTLNAILADNSISASIPTGTVTWNDANLGGTFNPSFLHHLDLKLFSVVHSASKL